MPDALTFTLYGLLIVACVLLFGAVMTFAGAWLRPRLANVEKGLKPVKGNLPCCPPGMGCNDTHADYRHCRRMEARKIGTVEEVIQLDRAWAKYHSYKKKNSKRARAALQQYGFTRDGIIERALTDAADKIEAQRRDAIPQLGTGQPTRITGESEVEESPKGSSFRDKVRGN